VLELPLRAIGSIRGDPSNVDVAAAGLDHFDRERWPKGRAFLQPPNTVLTPHIGGATYETEANYFQMIAEDLAGLLSGAAPRYIANPEVLA
jgi:D-3-phosphoglycerate dehydrogenase